MRGQLPPSLKSILAHAYHQARYYSMQRRQQLIQAEAEKAQSRLKELVGINTSASNPRMTSSALSQTLDKIGLRWMLQKIGLGLSAYKRLLVEAMLPWNEEGMISKLSCLNKLPEVLNRLMFDERKSRQAKALAAMAADVEAASDTQKRSSVTNGDARKMLLEPWRDWSVVHQLKPWKDPVHDAGGDAHDQDVAQTKLRAGAATERGA